MHIASKTVLLVDDNEDVRGMLSAILTGNGYEVVQAVDGLDALEKFKGDYGRISLVVTDVTMPRMDGFTSVMEMKKIDPAVKALFISGFLSDQPPSQGPLLVKPFTNHQFLNAVKTVLG